MPICHVSHVCPLRVRTYEHTSLVSLCLCVYWPVCLLTCVPTDLCVYCTCVSIGLCACWPVHLCSYALMYRLVYVPIFPCLCGYDPIYTSPVSLYLHVYCAYASMHLFDIFRCFTMPLCLLTYVPVSIYHVPVCHCVNMPILSCFTRVSLTGSHV